MYKSFFNFRRKPFELLPNPDFLYPSRSHKKVLSYLDYGIREHSGFILLTGEVGTGKTTLIRELIKKHLRNVLLARVFHTKVESRQLLAMINADLGLDISDKDKPALLRDLQEFLIEQYAKRCPVVLIIDEAQNLSKNVLEEVRMLSNLETENSKLLHIILVGQPELRRVLSDPDLLQLRQRIQIICNIEPLAEGEIEHYIHYRLEAAGNRDAIRIAPECFPIIHAYTRGIPRLINILCDYILLDAFANESREIFAGTIHEIAQDLNFNEQYWESTAKAVPQEQDKGGGAADASVKQITRQGILLKIDSRLQHIESRQASQLQALNGELSRNFEALNQRVDALWKRIGETRSALAGVVSKSAADLGRSFPAPERKEVASLPVDSKINHVPPSPLVTDSEKRALRVYGHDVIDLTEEVLEDDSISSVLARKKKPRAWLKWLLLGIS